MGHLGGHCEKDKDSQNTPTKEVNSQDLFLVHWKI